MRSSRFAALASAVWLFQAQRASSTDNTSIDFDRRAAAVQDAAEAGLTDGQASAPQPGQPAAAAQPPVNESDIQRLIVTFNKGTPPRRQAEIVAASGGVLVRDLWLIDAAVVVVPKRRAQAAAVNFGSATEVRRVESDALRDWLKMVSAPAPGAARGVPAAAAAAAKPGQTIPWGIGRVNAPNAWRATRGAGVKVAVVDTGIDFTHPDLKVAGGYNVLHPEGSYKDDMGHGTHVSGTIAAQDNDIGVVGVAPEVALYGVKVLNARGQGTDADVIGGLQWAVENKMDVVNMSLGSPQGSQAMADAVKAVADAGVTIVAAAGNSSGPVGFPAAYPQVIAVSALDQHDGLAFFSSRGPEVATIAPGVRVYSTWKGGGYKTEDGTSMACPHVTGMAALAAAARGVHGVDAIRAALTGAASALPKLSSEQQGAGLVDAAKLVAAGALPRVRPTQHRYGYELRWTGAGYSCLNVFGEHGYNTAYPNDVLRSRWGECADLRGADFSKAGLIGAQLGGANFFGAKLAGASLAGAELMGAVLASVDISGADMTGVNLFGANMAGADLSRAGLFTSDLTQADLTRASLIGAYAVYANFQGAKLTRTDLRAANLQGADTTGADLSGATYDDRTQLPFDAGTAARRGMLRVP